MYRDLIMAVLTANILDHSDVAAGEDGLDGVVIAPERRTEMHAGGVGGEDIGVVGGAGAQNARVLCTHWNKDDGVEFDAVAHGNHGCLED